MDWESSCSIVVGSSSACSASSSASSDTGAFKATLMVTHHIAETAGIMSRIFPLHICSGKNWWWDSVMECRGSAGGWKCDSTRSALLAVMQWSGCTSTWRHLVPLEQSQKTRYIYSVDSKTISLLKRYVHAIPNLRVNSPLPVQWIWSIHMYTYDSVKGNVLSLWNNHSDPRRSQWLSLYLLHSVKRVQQQC